ncbi:MAG: long-chain fatty acid--CoA ligase [Acidobacteriota bacterium]|nr:long-chain fatty acid--CoA ligase [Acidobacteriota bacterium]
MTDWLANHARHRADKAAVIELATGRRIVYDELNRRANQIRALLAGLGVRPGDRVGVLAGNCVELLEVLFGATKLGAIFVPLNWKLTAAELAPILADAEPVVLFHTVEHAELAQTIFRGRRVELSGATASDLPSDDPAEIPADLESPQILLYTSGTTGKPKGVVLSHRMILWNSINFSLRDLAATDTVLVHTPMFYTGGLNVYALPSLFLGGTVVVMKAFSPDEVLSTVEREKITVLFAVPTQLLMMADCPVFNSADLSSLRYVISGGAPCPVALIQRWVDRGVPFKQGFGLTEVGPNCFALEAKDALRKAGSIGFPHFSIEARIIDVEGGIGELVLRTPAMCSGYWNNPEQTAAAIRDGWFHTGDLAMFDSEGYCFIVDRKKDMFISGGENVYPAEVESVLREHPKIADVAVFGVPHPKWGEVGCAAVVLREGESSTEEEILTFCAGRIAKFKIPKSIKWMLELPRTVSGKIKKRELLLSDQN